MPHLRWMIACAIGALCFSAAAQGAQQKFEIQGMLDPPDSAAVLGLVDAAGHLVAAAPSDLEGSFHFRKLAAGTYTVFILARARLPNRTVVEGMRTAVATPTMPDTSGMRIVGEAWTSVRVNEETADSKNRVRTVVFVPPPMLASGLRQADQRLSSTARARLTFSRMSAALAVQTKGLGLSLCLSM